MNTGGFRNVGSQLVEATVKLLSRYGQAAPQFLTSSTLPANPAPYTHADIVFQPNQGPNAGRVYVTDVKLVASQFLPTTVAFGSLQKLSAVRNANLQTALQCALATNAMVAESVRQMLTSSQITLFCQVRSAEELANCILAWAHVHYR